MVNEAETMMSARIAMAMGLLVAALPAKAGEFLQFEDARRLIAGKLFSYSCFDGTTGSGRINADGSVAGVIRVAGKGPMRHMTLPPGTLHNRGGSVCATVKGMPLSPCFNVSQTGGNNFRGSIYGLSFAYCDFVQRGGRGHLSRMAQQRPPANPPAGRPD